jgi:hypothetical protein
VWTDFLDDDVLSYVNEEVDDDSAPRRKRVKLATNTYEETQELAKGLYQEGMEIKEGLLA